MSRRKNNDSTNKIVYVRPYLKSNGRMVLYFNSEATREISEKFKCDRIIFDYNNGKLSLLPAPPTTPPTLKVYKIQKKYNSIEITIPSHLKKELKTLGLVGKKLPVLISSFIIEIPLFTKINFFKPELVTKATGYKPIIITLTGSRFWRDWTTKGFFSMVKQFRRSWDDADYDFFTTLAIPSIRYSLPCVIDGNVTDKCVRDSLETQISHKIELRAVSFRNLTMQLLKSNANFVYYLTADIIHMEKEIKPLMQEYIKTIPDILRKRDFLMSLYGVTRGSMKSSEGQTTGAKDKHRYVNALRFAILTTYFYHNHNQINSDISFTEIRNRFDKIFSEVITIINPRYPDDILYYVIDLKDKIQKLNNDWNYNAVRDFLHLSEEIQLIIDKELR